MEINYKTNKTPLHLEPSKKSFGVNIGGYIASEKGLGEGVRANIRSIKTTDIPYVLNHFVDTHNCKNIDKTYTRFSKKNPYSINLVNINAFEQSCFMEKLYKKYLRNRYNIGFWAWEYSSFPIEWLSSFRYFNEIWVPSRFDQKAISLIAPIPVITIPHSLPEQLELLNLTRDHFGLPENNFIFLFVFSFHGHFTRKNPLGLIKAFQKAFNKKDQVCLVIKCAHAEFFPVEFTKIQKAAKDDKIIIIDKIMNRSEINTLIDLSDCYISLHRSEGFGLTMAEAMHLKKPIIATGYSGNMDFMNKKNSFLVKYKLTKVDIVDIMKRNWSPLPFQKGYVWAEPDTNHAAKLMRYVYRERKYSAKIGAQASEDVRRKLNPRKVGSLMVSRLKKINNGLV